MTRRFSSPPISSLAPPTDVIVPPRRQWIVRLARICRQPSWSRSLAERSVASGLPIALPTLGRCRSVLGEARPCAIACSTRCWRRPRVRSLSAGFAVFSRTRA